MDIDQDDAQKKKKKNETMKGILQAGRGLITREKKKNVFRVLSKHEFRSFLMRCHYSIDAHQKCFWRAARATQQRFPGLFRKAAVGAPAPKRSAGFLVPRHDVGVFQQLPVRGHPHFRPRPKARVGHPHFLVVGVHGEAEHERQPTGSGGGAVPKHLHQRIVVAVV